MLKSAAVLFVACVLVLFSSQSPAPMPAIGTIPLADEIVVTNVTPPVEFKDGKPLLFLPNLWHISSGAQACPISKTEALTARHVAVSAPLVWSYPGSALGGTLVRAWVDTRRDLALVRIAGTGPAFQFWYKIAEVPPKVGDKIFLQGYDNDEGWTSQWYDAKIIHLYAGNVDFDLTPGAGSSGSCILNERGEIVGINYAAYRVNPMARLKGSANLVTPPWTPGDPKWIVAGTARPDRDNAETDAWEEEG